MTRPLQPSVTPTALSYQPNRLLTTAAVLAALALVVVAGCTSATRESLPTVRDKIAETTIADEPKLRIGVYEDTPLMGYVDANGTRSGFEIDLARSIAKFLGFDESGITWVRLTTAERETALQEGRVHLVIASFSITDERKERIRFAGPYLVTRQAVLVPTELKEQIKEIGDLRVPGQRVCVTGASTSKTQLQNEGVEVETLTNREDCVEGLLDGRFRAMSSDRTILAGFVSRHPRDLAIVPMPFNDNELLGIGIPKQDAALEEVLTYYLHQSYEAEQDGEPTDWKLAYQSSLHPWLDTVGQPPPDGDPPELVDQDARNPR